MSRVHSKACLRRFAAIGAPLRRQHSGQPRIGHDVADYFVGRAATPSLNLVSVPPAVRGPERFRHCPLGADDAHRFLCRMQCFEIRVDICSMIGESLLELRLVGVGRTSDRDVQSIGEVKHVIDGADRVKLDGAAAEPVEECARRTDHDRTSRSNGGQHPR